MVSQTEENYLKALFKLSNETEQINLSDLSTMLEVSVPTANSMVKKLNTRGLLKYEKYKPLILTSKGKKMAALILRKHRLTEMYLVDKMGFSWEEVHQIAEQVEHIQSEAFFDRMDELLGYPKFDPHGSVIPDKDGNYSQQKLTKLSSCSIGDHVVLSALADSSEDLLVYLNKKEIGLGLNIKILDIESFDKTMTITYTNHSSEVLSKTVCDSLLVE